MSQIGETIFLPGMPVPSSPISTGTVVSGGGLEGMLNPANLINPATLIATMGGPAVAGLLDKLFGGRDQSFGRLPLPQRPQGQTGPLPEHLKPGATFEQTFGNAPPGYAYDEQGFLRNVGNPNDQGYYINAGGTPVASTPPLVPVPKPTAGGGGNSGGADGGFDDPNQVDPDIGGGGDLGGIGEGGGGPTPADKPPTQYTDDQWMDIVADWFIRFPNATQAEKEAAITQYGVPRDVVAQVEAGMAGAGGSGSGTGTGAGAGSGAGTGTGTGTGGAVPVVPPVVAPTVPATGTGTGTGTGVGPGAGSGSGGSSGSSGGMFSAQAPLPSELVFPELFKLKKDYEVINNLLTYRPQGLFR